MPEATVPQATVPQTTVIERSTIICPHCGFAADEIMPIDACQFFYQCRGCGTMLRPKPGDSCVFCSWGTVPCPPIQVQHAVGATTQCCGPPASA